MRHKSFDNFLISTMSIVALLSIYMLYGAKLANFGSGSEIKVASIVEQLKTVKRKRDFYQGWMDVKQGDGLSQNDEIYTHGQSSAKIRFDNGPEISLFENSLLRIKTLSNGSSFSLDKGNLIAKLSKENPNLDIELNGKKYSFNSQSANIQIEQGKTENKFLLLDGKAQLAGQEILQNQVVIQNIKTGNLQIKEIPFIPKLPLNNQTQYFVKETAVNFSWAFTNQQSRPLKLILAHDSKFEDIFIEEQLDTSSHSLSLNQAGTYYWKLSSDDNIDGPIRSFTMTEEMAPLLTADQTVYYQGPKSKEKIYFNWPKMNAKKYLVKIENPDGKIEEIPVARNNFELLPVQTGQYHVSVKVNETNRPLALWSEPLTIMVNKPSAITITSLTPEMIERVNYKNESTPYLLSWNGPQASVQYKIRVVRDNKIIEFETEQNSIPVNLKDAGLYSWEIQGETLSGVVSNKLTGKILIKAPLHITQLPSEGAVVELDKPDQLVAFKWDKIEEATSYQFELSEDSGFKKILLGRDVETNNISTSLAETGKYFWRVKIKRGNTIEYSNPVSVEVRPSPPLARPEVSPDIKIKLKYLDEKSSSFQLIDLFFAKAEAADQIAIAEWDLPHNPRAKSYIVEVYKDAELKELLTRIETEVPHVIWKNAAAGTFYWRVSYSDFWGRKTEFSKVSTLSTEAEIPPEIELQNPKHRAEILKKDSDTAVLEWDTIKNAKTYQVLISEDLDFEKVIYSKQVLQNELKISCKNIDSRSGSYYWKVVSGESTSKRRQFEAGCEVPVKVAEVKKEEMKTPVQQFKIEEFKKPDPHFFRAGLFPHHIAYENKSAQYSAKVDGNAIDSWYVMYQTPLDMKWFQVITPSLWVSRGKVFDTITFTDIEANVKAHHMQTSFSWGPVLAFMKKTLYVESNLKITDEGLSSPLAGIFIQKEFNSFTFDAEAKLGTMLNIQAGLQYRMRNNVSVGAIFDTTSVTKDNNKHSFSRYGLNVNYTFDLLDATK